MLSYKVFISFILEYFLVFFQEGVGIIAVNDAFFIESAVFSILRKYFREKAYYVDLMDLFHEVISRNHFYSEAFKILLNFFIACTTTKKFTSNKTNHKLGFESTLIAVSSLNLEWRWIHVKLDILGEFDIIRKSKALIRSYLLSMTWIYTCRFTIGVSRGKVELPSYACSLATKGKHLIQSQGNIYSC